VAGCTLHATLHPTDADSHALFEPAAGEGTPFVAFCLPASPALASLAEAALDDAQFASGGEPPCWVAASAASRELYLYGMAEGGATAREIYARLRAAGIDTESAAAEEAAVPSGGAATLCESARQGWHAVLLQDRLASGGEDHGVVAAALRGKLGLGPVAKPLNMQAVGGELYLVDSTLLAHLDALNGVQGLARAEATVGEGGGRMTTAWVYGSRSRGE